jgi:aspartate ammonia-lyase
MTVATVLMPTLGYPSVSKLARRSVEEDRPLPGILGESGLLKRADALSVIRQATVPVFESP